MTTAPTYDLHEVPASGTGHSRYALSKSPTGINVAPAANVLIAYERLLAERVAEAEPLANAKQVELKKIARTVDGTYVIVPLATITLEPVSAPRKSGKHEKREQAGGSFLDDFFGGRLFAFGKDEGVWEAAQELAEQESLGGSQLRRLSILVNQAVILRAGGSPEQAKPWNLPL